MPTEYCMDHSAHARAIKVHDNRLDEHGKELDQLSECVVRLTTIQEDNAARLKEIDDRLLAIENKPAEKWDKMSTQILTAVISFVIGLVMSSLGLSSVAK